MSSSEQRLQKTTKVQVKAPHVGQTMGNKRHCSEKNGILIRKVAVITASTDGIGFAIARRLAQDGAHVVLSSRRQKNVDRAVMQLQLESLSVTGITCDAGKEEDRQKLVDVALQTYGGIDFLVCNAAVNPFVGKTLDSTEAHWRKIFDVNVIATFLMVKLVVPHMAKQGSGSIILISSVAGYNPYLGIGPYSVSKAALYSLTKVLTLDLTPMNIRVNCVVPGLIRTHFSSFMWKDEKILNRIKNSYRFERLGEPEECAGIVSFLCSTDASYITGENIVVAGGGISRL